MSAINLEIPEGELAILERYARKEHVTPEEYLKRMILQSLKELRDFEYWRERGKRGNLTRFREILAKVPDAPPIPGDELPEGWKQTEK